MTCHNSRNLPHGRPKPSPQRPGFLNGGGVPSGFERHLCFAYLKELARNTQECSYRWNFSIATRADSRLLVEDVGPGVELVSVLHWNARN